jgi:hypothetical protein
MLIPAVHSCCSFLLLIPVAHSCYSFHVACEELDHNTLPASHMPIKRRRCSFPFLYPNPPDILLMLSCLQWFRQTVCKHFIRRFVLQLNDMILGKLSDVVSTNIDMLGAYMELWILGKCKSPLVISIDCCWLVLMSVAGSPCLLGVRLLYPSAGVVTVLPLSNPCSRNRSLT